MTGVYTSIYNLAGIRIRIDTPWQPVLTDAFLPFMEKEKEYDWLVSYQEVSQIPEKTQGFLYGNEVFRVYRKDEGVYIRDYYNDRADNSTYASVHIDTVKKQVQIFYLPEERGRFGSCSRDFCCIALEQILMEEHACILHASCVDTPYGGILFSGVSGAGKSTQADLWSRYGNGRILNGDRPIIRYGRDGFRAYGSPYAGSSGYHINESCLIKAIVFPRKAGMCEVHNIKGIRAFGELWTNLTVNSWDENFVSRASNMALQLIKEIPLYELQCTIEKEAVLVLQELLEGRVSSGLE